MVCWASKQSLASWLALRRLWSSGFRYLQPLVCSRALLFLALWLAGVWAIESHLACPFLRHCGPVVSCPTLCASRLGTEAQVRSNHSIERTSTGRPRLALISFWAKRVLPVPAAHVKRYVSGERGLSYQVGPQWATFTAPRGVRGFRTAASRCHFQQAHCVAALPLHRAGCPSRKLAASGPPVRLDANTNSSPLPLASAYPREPLLRSTAAGPGWPSTKAQRSISPKCRRTSSEERTRRINVLAHTGGSAKTRSKRGPNRLSRPSDET